MSNGSDVNGNGNSGSVPGVCFTVGTDKVLRSDSNHKPFFSIPLFWGKISGLAMRGVLGG